MNNDQIKMLVATIQKLHTRDAKKNIQKILDKTHVADIAAVLEHFSSDDGFELYQMVESIEDRSEILSHLSEENQKELMSRISKIEAMQVVTLMETDDAADLLGSLTNEQSQEILDSMVQEDSEEVADLMAYPEDSAGGIMNTEFLALNQNINVQEAIQIIQTEDEESPVAFYVYVISDNNQLVGVMSLKQLLLSRPGEKLKDLMTAEVITVSLGTDQEDVAKTVERYDFLSMPVTDSNNRLVGVITVDDVIDVIREEAEEDLMSMGQAGMGHDVSVKEHFFARSPWLFLSLLNGVICSILIYLFGAKSESGADVLLVWSFASFLPILYSVGTTLGSQVTTVMVAAIRAGKFDHEISSDYLKKEFLLSMGFSLILSLFVFFVGGSHYGWYLSGMFGVVIFIQVLVSALLGVSIPLLMKKFDLDPTSASSPIFVTMSQVFGVSLLFVFYNCYVSLGI